MSSASERAASSTQTDAILEIVLQPRGYFKGEPRLAATAGAGERKQPARGQALLHLGQLPLASDEAA